MYGNSGRREVLKIRIMDCVMCPISVHLTGHIHAIRESALKFVTIRELRSSTAAIRKDLAADEEIVVTANGRPIALLTPLDADNFEQELMAARRARAATALERLRAQARASGTADLSMEQLDDLVAATRKRRSPRA